MTELEKAKCGRYEAIDLNVLAEEIRVENYDYMDTCRRAAKTSREEFKKLSMNVHMKPADNMMYAVTALLAKANIKDGLIPQYMAALYYVATTIANVTNDPERTTRHAEMFKQLLTECTMMVHCSVPDPNHHETN